MTSRTVAVAIGLLAALAAFAAAPVQAHHQDHIILSGTGDGSPAGGGSAAVSAPPWWNCSTPAFVNGAWETECDRGDWCAEPLVDVVVNGFGFPGAAVTGTSSCQAYTGGTPTQSVSASCIALMPLGFLTGSCSGFSPGFVSGTSVVAICRAQPVGTFIDDWTVDCGIISGT